jgi:WD40 repeat protein
MLGPDDGVYLLDTESGQQIERIRTPGDWTKFHGVLLNPKGDLIATQGDGGSGREPGILVFEKTGSAPASLIFSVDHSRNQFGVDFALDGEGRLLAVMDNGFIQLWDLQSKQDWGKLEPDKDQPGWTADPQIGAMAIDPTRQWLANASAETNASPYITLWQLNERHIKWQAELDTPYIHALIFSPTGQLLAAGASDGVHIWSVDTGQELKTFSGTSTFVVTFSPDGSLLAWGDRDGILHLAALPGSQ